MLKAISKSVFLSLTFLTLIIAAGCTSPEERKNAQIKKAEQLESAGSLDEALEILNELNETFPNDAAILRKIGSIFTAQGDATSAAFFLEQAYTLSPDDYELLYATYLAQKEAGLPTKALLETLAEKAPGAMSGDLWIELGADRAELGETQAALDAYLRAINTSGEAQSPETATAIGTLFLELGNNGQAQSWLEIAAESEDPDALTALFGLLEINLSEKNWEAAITTIERLDRKFPGAVDASEWSSARGELQRWKDAQEKMKAELAALEAAKQADAEEKESAEAGSPEENEGKSDVVAAIEQAEAMADTPAIEVAVDGPIESDPEAIEPKAITFDPSIAIQPAEPDFNIGVTFDQQSQSDPVEYSVGSPGDISPTPIVTDEPITIEDLISDAQSATLDRNYGEAIRIYWQILGQANDRADIWNELARLYTIDGQLKNAETTALEATRLAPRNTDYMLDYLRVAQRSKPASDFLAELETAHDRFPQSPEIALSLARAYERIGRNRASAVALYTRFVDLAPNHPLRPEAESAIARLR